MNGSPSIQIIKPFEDAIAETKRILFQPFAFEKWIVIGFAAFLAGHVGGGGFNFPLRGFPNQKAHPDYSFVDWDQWKPWLPMLIIGGGILFLVLVILFSWLRARGNFIYTDCIARNRAAIAEPWREYRVEGNSYFLFILILMFGSFAVIGVLCLGVLLPFGVFSHGFSSEDVSPLLIVALVLIGIVWICLAFFFSLTSFFMIPLMYVRRYRAAEAFGQVARLIMQNLGSLILFCLFSFCLLIGVGIISGLATCLTCCIAALPYVGTVILLPVYVCLRTFGLLYIRQFGPDYDVWAKVSESVPPPPTTEPPALAT